MAARSFRKTHSYNFFFDGIDDRRDHRFRFGDFQCEFVLGASHISLLLHAQTKHPLVLVLKNKFVMQFVVEKPIKDDHMWPRRGE